jgi:hypothetical protein
MALVALGKLASRPLVISVPTRAGGYTVTMPTAPVAKGEKLAGKDRLEEARSTLAKSIAEFVPDSSTAEGWVAEFERHCDGPPTAELFADFTALLYLRTKIPQGAPGHLAVSSCYTYLRYVTGPHRYKRFSHLPCFRAVETEAASIGSKKKAPSAGLDHIAVVKDWMANGPNAELKDRSGAWIQTCTGGRTIDVKRLRGGGLQLTKDRTISAVSWLWTKSIRQPKDAKVAHPPQCVRDAMGPAPFSEKQWSEWSKGGEAFALPKYDSAEVNVHLARLSKDFTEKLTSTSLRDIYNRLVAGHCDNDTSAMVKFTPHKSAKSLDASYMFGRKVSKKKEAKKEGKKETKKKH